MKRTLPHLSKLAVSICILGNAIWPSLATAENWDVGFQPHIEIGVADYTLDVSSVSQFRPTGSTSGSKLSFGATMPTLSAGLSVFADRYFLDLAVQRMQMFGQNMDDSQTIIGTDLSFPGFQTVEMSYDSDDFIRDEYSLSLGYGITESISVYVGYKKQYTTINQLQADGPVVQHLPGGSLIPVGTLVTSGDYKFNYDGPFVGGTTSWKITTDALKGRFAVNAAVAFLKGSLYVTSENAFLNYYSGQSELSDVKPSDILDTSGDAVGITLGASWVGQTAIAGLSYTAAINGYSYDFSADNQGRADMSEDVLQFKLGIAYAL